MVDFINFNSITLKYDLINKTLIIIRPGKELFSYINQNLYDLFPNYFKNHQINLFLNLIFKGFQMKPEFIDENEINKNIFESKVKTKYSNTQDNALKFYTKGAKLLSLTQSKEEKCGDICRAHLFFVLLYSLSNMKWLIAGKS